MMLPAEISVLIAMFLAVTNVLILEFCFNDTLTRPLASVLTSLGTTTFVYCLVGLILELSCQVGIELNQGICSNSHLRVGIVIISIVVTLISSMMMSVIIYFDKRKLFR